MAETTDLQKLIVSLEARTKEYEKALAKAQGQTVRQLRSMEKEAQGFTARFNAQLSKVGVGVKFGIAGLATGGLAALAEFARSTIKDAADIGDLADKLGLSPDKVQELQYGAVQANMSFEDLSSGLLKFSKAMGQARNGSGDLRDLLNANGFSDAQIKAMSYAQALTTVADLIHNARSEQDAFLIVTQAFGKGNDGFAELLRDGSRGLREFAADAHDAGAVIDDALIRKAQELDDRWAALMQSLKSRTQETVLTIADMLGALFKTGENQVAGAREKILLQGTRFGNGIGQPAIPAISGTVSAPGKGDLPVTPGKPTTVYNPTDASNAKKFADEQKRKAEAIQRVIQALKEEQIGLSQNSVEQEIANRLSQAGVTANSEQGKQIIALVKANDLLRKSQELATESGEEMMQRYAEIKSGLADLAEQGFDAFEQIATGAGKASDVLKELLANLLDALAKGALFGSGPLGALLGGSGGGGLFSTLFSGLGGSSFAGLYASGGQIPSGKIGIAGEAGPEWIRGPANVTPIKSGGGGSSKVAITLNLAGVNGNTEVARIAREAVKQGLREYDRQRPLADVERNLRVA